MYNKWIVRHSVELVTVIELGCILPTYKSFSSHFATYILTNGIAKILFDFLKSLHRFYGK